MPLRLAPCWAFSRDLRDALTVSSSSIIILAFALFRFPCLLCSAHPLQCCVW